MRYHTVLWDLDGTLVDSSPGVRTALAAACAAAGVPMLPEEEFWRSMGPAVRDNARINFGLSGDREERFVETFLEIYAALPWERSGSLYPGIFTLLGRLTDAKIKSAVCTMKDEKSAVEMLTSYDVSPFFETIAGVDDAAPCRKEETIADCMLRLGVPWREGVLMVGDTLLDAEAAAKAGVDFAAALWGFGFGHGELARCSAVCAAETPEELGRFLLER